MLNRYLMGLWLLTSCGTNVAEFGSGEKTAEARSQLSGGTGNGDFAYEEIDYESVLPGLDIVRINPMLTERDGAWISAHNTGWIWDFEMRLSNPWNVGASSSTLQHMGRVTILRSAYTGASDADNFARGLFYSLNFTKYGSSATLVDLLSGTTNTFVSVLGIFGTEWERLSSRVFRDGTTIVYEYEDTFDQSCSSVRIKHVPSGAFTYVKRGGAGGECVPLEVTLPNQSGASAKKIIYAWSVVDGDAYGLNGRVQLSQVTYPDGSIKKYNYKRLNSSVMSGLTSVIDEENRPEMTFEWSGDKVIASYAGPASKPQGRVSSVDNADGTRTVSDAEGVARVVKFKEWTNSTGTKFRRTGGMSSPCAWCGADPKEVEYNEVGLITKTIDQRGVVTTMTPRFSNGVVNNVTTKVIAAGTPEAKTISTTWHTDFNLPIKHITTDASGDRVTTEVSYDAKGRPTRVASTQSTRTLDGSIAAITKVTTTGYTFHANGQIAAISVDGPRPAAEANDVVTSTFSGQGLLISEQDALGVTTYSNFDDLGRAQTVTRPNGVTTTMAYDWAGRVLTRTTAGVTTRYTYYRNGLLRSETTPGTSEVTTYEYDDANRLHTATDALGNRREYTSDALGRRVLMREGNIVKSELALSLSSTYTNAGRTVEDYVTASTQKLTSQYDNTFQITSVRDELNKTSAFARDSLGRFKSSLNAANLLAVPQFDVNNQAKRTTYSGPEGSTRSRLFEYTPEVTGARWESKSADTGTDTLLRDLAGNLVDASNTRGGFTVRRTFDALNRVKQAAIVNPSTNSVLGTVNYIYDANPDGTTPAPLGLLTQVTGSFGSAKYFYDARGNVTKKTQSHGAASVSDLYSYDPAGRVVTTTYPSGRVVRFTRDAVGRPSLVETKASGSAPWTIVADAISYSPLSNVSDAKELRFGGAFVAKRGRDTSGQVTSYSEGVGNNLITVKRRADGFVSQLVSSSGSVIASYDYDLSNRLKSASVNGVGTQAYVFETTGDLKTLTEGTIKSFTYVNNSSTLSSVAGTPWTYTQRGLVTSNGTLTLTYDARGLVATAKKGAGTRYSYTYDALGRRQSKTPAGGVATNFSYDIEGRLISEFNASTGETLREYIWQGARPLMMVIPAKGSTPERRYFIYTDDSNTPFRLTDTSGTTVWQWTRNPFGSNAPSVKAINFNLRMPGQYYDEETGLHYNGARYYHPATGRYLQPDPRGEAAGMSAYTYADGDPVNFIDATGLSPGSTLYDHRLGTPITVTASGAYSGGRLAGASFSMAGWRPYSDDPYFGPRTDFTPTEEFNEDSGGLDLVSAQHGKQGIEPVYIIEELAAMVAGAGITTLPSVVAGLRGFKSWLYPALPRPYVRRLEFPATHGNLGGFTLPKTGQIILNTRTSFAMQRMALRHERLHSALRLATPAPLRSQLQSIKMKSQILRYSEEALAQGYAARSVREGLAFPFLAPDVYGITKMGLAAEAVSFGAAGALGYFAIDELGGE